MALFNMTIFYCRHLSNIYTKGNGTISVRLREGEDQFLEGEIRKEITYVSLTMLNMINHVVLLQIYTRVYPHYNSCGIP